MDAIEILSCVFAFRPWYDGRTVWSLPISIRRRPEGSLELGMSALKSDLHIMSFIAKWRLARSSDCLQTSPGVVASWISCFAALALVWDTKVEAQVEANCHSDRFIT